MNSVVASRIVVLSALLALVLTLAACAEAGTPEPECEDGGEPWSEYRLFFGRNVGDTEVVSDEDWRAFLADTITPRFPDGLSVIDVNGQGTTEDGDLARERAKLLTVLVPPGNDSLARMNEISDEYKQRFNHYSVLRVVTEACVAFK